MSWYSDREPFDEHDPDYCASCDGGDGYEECERCRKRHEGHWTKVDVCTYRCSKCGKIQIADEDGELNYCCYCGAKMKGGKG